MLQVGACAGETAWGFPIRQPELLLPAKAILEGWNPVHNGHGADALLAHVVRQIRTWRPSVILVPADRGCDGLPQIVQQTVVAAVKLAGDPTFLADQFGPAGCEPWNVERVYLVSATFSPLPPAVPGRMGETQGARALGKIALAANDWSSGLGQTWADVALLARGLLDDDYQEGPAMVSVQLIAGGSTAAGTFAQATTRPRVGESTNRFDIMSGVASIDGPSRRPMAGAGNTFGGPLDGLAQGRQVQAVFEHIEHDPQTVLARLAKGDELPAGIDASAAAALTFRIAQRFRQTGHCGPGRQNPGPARRALSFRSA